MSQKHIRKKVDPTIAFGGNKIYNKNNLFRCVRRKNVTNSANSDKIYRGNQNDIDIENYFVGKHYDITYAKI